MRKTIYLLVLFLVPIIPLSNGYANTCSGSQNTTLTWSGYNTGVSAPIIVWIHGGGWYQGCAEKEKNILEQYKQDAHSILSVHYDLINFNQTPYVDIYYFSNVINDIKEQIKLYNGGNRDIYLLGSSAGAHLALMLALQHGNELNIKKVMAYSALTDFGTLQTNLTQLSAIASTMSLANRNDSPFKTLLNNSSPSSYLKTIEFFVIHSVKDQVIPFNTQAAPFFSLAKEKGLNINGLWLNSAQHSAFKIAGTKEVIIQKTECFFFNKNCIINNTYNYKKPIISIINPVTKEYQAQFTGSQTFSESFSARILNVSPSQPAYACLEKYEAKENSLPALNCHITGSILPSSSSCFDNNGIINLENWVDIKGRHQNNPSNDKIWHIANYQNGMIWENNAKPSHTGEAQTHIAKMYWSNAPLFTTMNKDDQSISDFELITGCRKYIYAP